MQEAMISVLEMLADFKYGMVLGGSPWGPRHRLSATSAQTGVRV